jgi:hypothetical protein
MNAVNGVMRAFMGAIMTALAPLPPWLALLLISAVAGVLAALAFRFTSNQKALRRVADQVRANLLALRLYKDDTLVTFKAIGGLFKASVLRLFHSLLPMLVLIVPFVLILAQMAMYYEFRPFKPGETIQVEARVNPAAWDVVRDLPPQLPDGVSLEAHVRDEATRTLYLRLRAEKPTGPATIVWRLPDGRTVEKQIVVAAPEQLDRLWFTSPLRPYTSFWDRVLYPGEPGLAPAAPIWRIELNSPSRSTPILGAADWSLAQVPVLDWIVSLLGLMFDTHWIVTFFVASIIAALIAKPYLKVQF